MEATCSSMFRLITLIKQYYFSSFFDFVAYSFKVVLYGSQPKPGLIPSIFFF